MFTLSILVGNKIHKDYMVNSWVGKFLWRREWQSTPVFLPAEFHGQRSLAGYRSWSRKELDTTEPLTHTHITATSYK